MKKISKSKKKIEAAPRIDPYLEGLMGKLLEHLVTLEKKVDALSAQNLSKPVPVSDQSKPVAAPEVKQPPRRDKVYYEAICADCHKVCEVPFRPSETRPVYCKECFGKRKSGGRSNGMPVLTPVAPAPKPVNDVVTTQAALPAPTSAPKKKNPPPKKSKKKR